MENYYWPSVPEIIVPFFIKLAFFASMVMFQKINFLMQKRVDTLGANHTKTTRKLKRHLTVLVVNPENLLITIIVEISIFCTFQLWVLDLSEYNSASNSFTPFSLLYRRYILWVINFTNFEFQKKLNTQKQIIYVVHTLLTDSWNFNPTKYTPYTVFYWLNQRSYYCDNIQAKE